MAVTFPIEPTDKEVLNNTTISKSQIEFINQKTPSKYIKQRPGPSGSRLSYVEVGYVINVLNQVFSWDWDFHIQEEQVGRNQVFVRGELTVRIKDHPIVKSQYGGSDIRKNRDGQPINIADDLKTAASDCLKKCSSLLGIAGDIYWKDLDSQIH